MQYLALVGLIIGFGSIIAGHGLEGGHLYFLWQASSAIIVLGGSLGATLIQTSSRDLLSAFKCLKWLLKTPVPDLKHGIEKVNHWSQKARSNGFLSLERLIKSESDPFLKKGLQLLADGNDSEKLKNALEVEIYTIEEQGLRSAKVYESMGGYAPTVGIIGAVLGLIHVMQNLSETEAIGSGIATAFVATLYGVGLANLLLLPIASRIESIVSEQLHFRQMMVEGMSAIANGENPRKIEYRLQGFLQKV